MQNAAQKPPTKIYPVSRALGLRKNMSEPQFTLINPNDPKMQKAYDKTSDTISDFVDAVELGGHELYLAKLRFRDPDLSEETGKDQFLYLWLSEVYWHRDEDMLSGVFFEVPEGLEKWHKVGDRLGFDPEDVFDWMIQHKGRMWGGHTIRVTRENIESHEGKKQYDKYIGVSSYETSLPVGQYT